MNPSEKSNSNKKEKNKEIDQIENDNLTIGNEDNPTIIKEDKYVFGWGQYSEITNGRFAMIGFAAIILIEVISRKSFFDWAGIIH